MLKEKSVGAIIFYENEDGKREYLLLNYPQGHWDFCKGHIENNETELQTLKREMYEETGIKEFELFQGFREKISYYFYNKEKKKVYKEVIFYLVRVKDKKVRLSHEHKAYVWLNYEEALKKLTYGNAKELLKKAESFLNAAAGIRTRV